LPESSSERKDKRRIGEILVDDGLVKKVQVDEALQEQRKGKGKKYLGQILMRRKLVDEREVFKRLSRQRGISFHEVKEKEIPEDLISKIPREVALEHGVLPVDYKNGELAVSMDDPFNQSLLRLLSRIIPAKIKPGITPRGDLHFAINRAYNNLLRSNPLVKEFFDGFAYLLSQPPFDANKVIDLVLAMSHLLDASDIHSTFSEEKFALALRIQGQLHSIPIPTRRLDPDRISQLRNTLKIRSGIDVSKRGIPLDGRIKMQIDEGTLQARVSTLPLIDGEKIVLRIVGKLKVMDFDQLGFSRQDKDRVKLLLKRPTGLILVAGPIGSGKTTTLYALLNKIPTETRNVITIEDPVEVRLGYAAQVQVNRDQGLTFESVMQAIARQDPDIILLSDIYSRESAHIAVESALTGHLILASVHMEHAAGTILRLLNMGVEPFALSAALNMIIAQRLIPGICLECHTPHPKNAEFCRELKLPEDTQLYTGTGCKNCYFTGRSGRVALIELIVVDDELRDIITAGPTLTGIVKHVMQKGSRNFRQDALAKCVEGKIAPEDVITYS